MDAGGDLLKKEEFAQHFQMEWLAHLGLDEARWPRKVGVPKPGGQGRSPFMQVEVANEVAYFQTITKYLNGRDVYTQLYSDIQRGERRWDKIYMDVDVCEQHPTLSDVHGVMQEIVALTEGQYSYTPRVYFSGTKGFAVYLDFDPVQMKVTTLKTWVEEQIIDRLGITLDTTVLGDKSRISRVPYTLNYNALKYRVCQNCLHEWRVDKKSEGAAQGDLCPNCKEPGVLQEPLRACIPIDPTWDIKRILSEAAKPVTRLPVEVRACPGLALELLELDEELPEPAPVDSTYMADEGRARKVLLHIKECAPKIQDGRHRLLAFVIIPNLVEVYAGDVDKIMGWCYAWLEVTGKNPALYDQYIRTTLQRTLRGNDGKPWAPWHLQTYIERFPEFAECFLLDLPEGFSQDQLDKAGKLEVVGFQVLRDRIQGEVRSSKGETIYSCGFVRSQGGYCTCEAGTRKLNCVHVLALLMRVMDQNSYLMASFLCHRITEA